MKGWGFIFHVLERIVRYYNFVKCSSVRTQRFRTISQNSISNLRLTRNKENQEAMAFTETTAKEGYRMAQKSHLVANRIVQDVSRPAVFVKNSDLKKKAEKKKPLREQPSHK